MKRSKKNMLSSVRSENLSISISLNKIKWFLMIIVFSVSFLSTFGYFSKYVLGHGRLFGIAFQFDLDQEGNIATFISSTLLLIVSFILLFIALCKHKMRASFRNHWLFLSILFAYIALDEAVQLHEQLSDPIKEAWGTVSWFYFAWVIPGFLILLLMAVLFYKFYQHLPRQARTNFTIAGSIYIGGALIIEMIGGHYAYHNGLYTLTYGLITTLEETMELLGTSIFIFALLQYIKEEISPRIELTFEK